MDVIRRNTDYAIRLVINLVKDYGKGPKSARQLADEESVVYGLACKLLQKLSTAWIVKSTMGPKGGFEMAKEPCQISLLEVVGAIQGPVVLNSCLDAGYICSRQQNCAVNMELAKLQKQIEDYLANVKLDSLLNCGSCDCDGK